MMKNNVFSKEKRAKCGEEVAELALSEGLARRDFKSGLGQEHLRRHGWVYSKPFNPPIPST
jgi:hypothetical protein